MKTNTILAATIAMTATAGMVQADEPKENEAQSVDVVDTRDDIVSIASNAEDFSTLVAAIKAAGLVETLKGKGPFTVFAPTNKAFENLPEGVVIELLEPENKEKLVKVLTYHVVPGKVLSENAATMPMTTVEGSQAAMTLDGDTVMIDGAKVIEADIEASNGVIHVVDKVLLPSPKKSSESSDQ